MRDYMVQDSIYMTFKKRKKSSTEKEIRKFVLKRI